MFSLARALAPLLLLSATAHALPDQSICYQVKDSLKLKGTLEPDASTVPLQPGCKLSKTRYLCVPALANASNVVDRKTGPISPTFFEGRPTGEQLCYKIRCKRPFPENAQAQDLFGSRMLENLRPGLYCTPLAREACDVCEGSCLDDQVCELLTGPSLPNGPECRCRPGNPCRDGTCPAGQRCEWFSLDGVDTYRECIPDPPVGPSCGGATAPQCDGACPSGFFCTTFGLNPCACLAFAISGVQCGDFEGAPECAGECPSDKPVCADVGGTCECTP